MKKIIFFIIAAAMSFSAYAQSWTASGSSLYSPISSSSYVGIGIVPAYKLDVNGKLMLRTVDSQNSVSRSYIHWESGALQLGTPYNVYGTNYVDLKPGGFPGTSQHSVLRMYYIGSIGNVEDNIVLNSSGSSWFMGGRLGVGTKTPTTLLDIRGGIRGSELKICHNTNTSGPDIQLHFQGNCWFNNDGNVGIGTTTPNYKLDVNGAIRANEIIVNTTGADFVFEGGYHLMPLGEVKEYIEANHHLPSIQSAAEMQQNGVSISELQTQLLQKVEELTLYILQQQATIENLQNEISELKK